MSDNLPHDEAAERAVLGACMESGATYRTARTIVAREDFFSDQHRLVWDVIGWYVDMGATPDVTLIFDRVRELGKISFVDGVMLHSMMAAAPMSLEVAHHARIVADVATRRRVVRAGQLMVQRAESGAGDITDLVEQSLDDLRSARNAQVGVEVLTSSVDEFMHSTPDQPDWVVPGLLARGDRLVLTGSGGLGKSTLLRQIAVCAAAGIDPLDWSAGEAYDPVRVMVFDCENADHQLKTRLWSMLKEARESGRPVEDRLTIGGHGNPLNLLDASSALSLLRTVEHDKPDLVYIGPVYKLHNDDPDKETVVKKITHVLDQIRQTGAALMTEAHHTKAAKQGGSLEPSGSNLWTWWPEHGMGLRLTPDSDASMRLCTLERWRISRVESSWPELVCAGGSWPWHSQRPNPYYLAGVS